MEILLFNSLCPGDYLASFQGLPWQFLPLLAHERKRKEIWNKIFLPNQLNVIVFPFGQFLSSENCWLYPGNCFGCLLLTLWLASPGITREVCQFQSPVSLNFVTRRLQRKCPAITSREGMYCQVQEDSPGITWQFLKACQKRSQDANPIAVLYQLDSHGVGI